MVLRRDLAVSGGARDSNPDRPADECPAAAMANEQPVMKRQRIESKSTTAEDTKSAPPDIIASPQQSINGSGCSSSTSSPSVSLTHSCTPETATPTSGDELDNVSRILPEEDIPRISPSFPDLLKVTPIDGDVADLHSHLTKQCLCGVNENLLRRLFQPENGKCGGRGENLKEWPPVKTMQFLSNIQLLFDVYLPQNIKGFICVGVLEACEMLLLQEITLIDEITQLCDHENKFVRFLAGRVLASFLLVAMKYMNVANEKLRPIVENFRALERIDEGSVRKVGVSAEILRRIVEWKNAVEHPLDEEEEDEEPMDLPPPVQPPPIETNYFATHYNPDMVAAAQTSSASARSPAPRPVIRETENGCRQMRLTDSESFDTGSLKLGMIETLKEEWPSIVESMSMVIRNWRDIPGAEECVVAFLTFWESVISVRANLPIKETLPFHVPLNDLEKLLSAHLPGTIYKQMLTLFNEALCYGSTLALQDHPPDESCLIMFAAQIVQQISVTIDRKP
uniref:Protein Lines N-terminal domain-containing protein n=1 Tax=Phlebotomus papatasi TaxID=29031 RepID=A0A1B0DBC2_PHLPP